MEWTFSRIFGVIMALTAIIVLGDMALCPDSYKSSPSEQCESYGKEMYYSGKCCDVEYEAVGTGGLFGGSAIRRVPKNCTADVEIITCNIARLDVKESE